MHLFFAVFAYLLIKNIYTQQKASYRHDINKPGFFLLKILQKRTYIENDAFTYHSDRFLFFKDKILLHIIGLMVFASTGPGFISIKFQCGLKNDKTKMN